MKVERLSAKQIQFVKNELRHDMAETVREIYQSWGLSRTRFCPLPHGSVVWYYKTIAGPGVYIVPNHI